MADKLGVNYRIAEDENRCSSCMNWRPPNGCEAVDGEISEDATCDLFEQSQDALMSALFGGGPQQ